LTYLVTMVLMVSASESGLITNQKIMFTMFTNQMAYETGETVDYWFRKMLTPYRFNPSRSINFHGVSDLTESD
jgi:hypothetical protein